MKIILHLFAVIPFFLLTALQGYFAETKGLTVLPLYLALYGSFFLTLLSLNYWLKCYQPACGIPRNNLPKSNVSKYYLVASTVIAALAWLMAFNHYINMSYFMVLAGLSNAIAIDYQRITKDGHLTGLVIFRIVLLSTVITMILLVLSWL